MEKMTSLGGFTDEIEPIGSATFEGDGTPSL